MGISEVLWGTPTPGQMRGPGAAKSRSKQGKHARAPAYACPSAREEGRGASSLVWKVIRSVDGDCGPQSQVQCSGEVSGRVEASSHQRMLGDPPPRVPIARLAR